MSQNISNSNKNINKYIPYLFSFPLLMTIILVFFYPLVSGFALSLFDKMGFVGLKNYFEISKDARFWNSIYLTILYVIFYVLGVFVFGMITAYLIWSAERANIKGHKAMQMFITLPYAMPEVVTCIVWLWLLSPGKTGIINYFLSLLGVGRIEWFQNPDIALFSVILVTIWRFFPLQTLILLGGFRSIAKEHLEAAELEGASPLIIFLKIVLPQIKDIMGLLLLITIIWSFKRFTITWLLTGGGPGDASELTSIFVYKNAFIFLKRNYAATAGTILVIITSLVVLFYILKILKGQESEGIL